MSALVKFAVNSERLYLEQNAEQWLWSVAELFADAARSDVVRELSSWPLELELDHVGALVVDTTEQCRAHLFGHGYQELVVKKSVVMADILGMPVDIVEGKHPGGKYRCEFFCPQSNGLAGSRKELVNNWGRMGYGVHVGFKAPSRDLVMDAIKALCLGTFIAPHWVREAKAYHPAQWVCYLDGLVEWHRVRIEVFGC